MLQMRTDQPGQSKLLSRPASQQLLGFGAAACLLLSARGVLAQTATAQAASAPVASNPASEQTPLVPLLKRYRLVAESSEVGFDGKSTMHDWTAKTKALTGSLVSGFPEFPNTSGGSVVVESAKLDSDSGMRDDEMRTRLNVKQYPELRFTLSNARPSNSGQPGSLELTGDFLIHGVSQSRALDAQVSEKSGGLAVNGRLGFPMSSHGITAPDMLVVTVEDRIEVWFDLLWQPVEAANLPARAHQVTIQSSLSNQGSEVLVENSRAQLFWAESGALLELPSADRWIVSTASGVRSLTPSRQRLEASAAASEAEWEQNRAKLAEAKQKYEGLTAAQKARAGASLQRTIERLEQALAGVPQGTPNLVEEGGLRRLSFGSDVWFEAEGSVPSDGPMTGNVGPLLATLPGLPAAVRAELSRLPGVPSRLLLVQLEGAGRRQLEFRFGPAVTGLLPASALKPEDWCQAAEGARVQ